MTILSYNVDTDEIFQELSLEEDEDINLKLLAKLLKNCKSTFQIEEFNQCINLYIKINSNFDSLHYFFIYKNGKVLNKLIKLIGEFKNV